MFSFNNIRLYIANFITLSVLIFSFGLNAYPEMMPENENEVEEMHQNNQKYPKGQCQKRKSIKL